MNESNCICREHSGVEKTLNDHDRNIIDLWHKWDSMNNKLISGLVALVLQLIGTLFLIIRTYL